MDIKENLAKNLSALRKANHLTQLELADKINYSDKAVSKWERGEAVPDLYVLKQLADLYGVKIDDLISEPKKEKHVSRSALPKKRLILSLSATVVVWLVATILFTFSSTLLPSVKLNWLFFLWSVPITNFVLLCMSSYWGKTKINFFISSMLTWTLLIVVYITLRVLLINPPTTLWMMFLIGIPVQILLVLFFLYKKVK